MQVLFHQRVIPLVEVRKFGGIGSSGDGCRVANLRNSGFAQPTVRRHAGGFTLVELMITLAIALVLIMIAVPSFQRITASSRLTTAANDVVSAISIARMEAIKRNTSTQLCGSAANGSDTLGTTCGAHVGAVYALINGTATEIRASTTSLVAPLASTLAAVRFSGQGLGRAPTGSALFDGSIADVSISTISTDNHRCVRMTAGSIVATTTSSQACP